jgi:glycosyltransferase involved in cell wall biosynthesis
MEWSGIHGEYKDNPFTVYPQWADAYGGDVCRPHSDHWDADICISLVDVWVCQNYAATLPNRWVPYFPIDSAPVPEEIWGLAKKSIAPVTYSRWGQEELAKIGMPDVDYVPHGVGDSYRPNREAGKVWRTQNGIPQDAFLVGGVWANKGNPSRKNFDGNMRAFAKFAKKHDDAYLYLHCEPSLRYGGVDVWRLVKELDVQGKVIIPNSYLNVLGYEEEWMSAMYNALDVYLGTTKGEGWGIPVTEAQAVGVPCIVTDYSALVEQVEHNGPKYKVEVAEWELCPLHSRFAMPKTEDVYNGLEFSYNNWRGKAPFPELVEWGKQWYWETIIRDWWGPFLNKVEHKLNTMPWVPASYPVLSSGK